MTMLSTPSKLATVLSVQEMPLMRSFLPDFKSSHPQPLSVAPNTLQIHSVFPYGEPLAYRKLGLQVSPRFYATRDGRSVLKIRTRDFSSACEMQMPCSKGAEKSLGSPRMRWCLRFTGFRGGAFSFRAGRCQRLFWHFVAWVITHVPGLFAASGHGVFKS